MIYLNRNKVIDMDGFYISAWNIAKGDEQSIGFVTCKRKSDGKYHVILRGKDEGMFVSLHEVRKFLKVAQ